MNTITYWDAWQVITGGMRKSHDATMITLSWALSSKRQRMVIQTVEDDYTKMTLFRQWEEWAQATIHNQQSEHRRRSWNIITYSIYSWKIISVFSIHDWAIYAWTSVESTRVRTATSCRVSQQSTFPICRVPFNLHLVRGISFLQTWDYRLHGTEICQHQHITVWGMFRGVVV